MVLQHRKSEKQRLTIMLLYARCTISMVAIASMSVATRSEGWKEFQGYEYKLMEGPLCFWEAEQGCVRHEAHLASIHSEQENNIVFGLTTPKGMTLRDHAWIGLYRVESGWQWTDGTDVDYLKWDKIDPNNSENNEYCVYMYEWEKHIDKNGYWADYKCHYKVKHYVCKRHARHMHHGQNKHWWFCC